MRRLRIRFLSVFGIRHSVMSSPIRPMRSWADMTLRFLLRQELSRGDWAIVAAVFGSRVGRSRCTSGS